MCIACGGLIKQRLMISACCQPLGIVHSASLVYHTVKRFNGCFRSGIANARRLECYV